MIENSHNLAMLVEVLNAIKRNQAIDYDDVVAICGENTPTIIRELKSRGLTITHSLGLYDVNGTVLDELIEEYQDRHAQTTQAAMSEEMQIAKQQIQTQKKSNRLARASNKILSASNMLAKESNSLSRSALILSMVSLVVSIISLLKSC